MGAVAELYVKVHADTSEFSKEIKDKLASSTGLTVPVGSTGGAKNAAGAKNVASQGLVAGLKAAGVLTAIAVITGIAVKGFRLAKDSSKAVQGILNFIQGTIGTATDLMVVGILSLFKAFSPGLTALKEGVVDGLLPTLGMFKDDLSGLFSLFKDKLVPLITPAFTTIFSIIGSYVRYSYDMFHDYISPAIQAVANFFGNHGESILGGMGGIIQMLLAFNKLLWILTYGQVFTLLTGIFTGLDAGMTALGSILDVLGLGGTGGIFGSLTGILDSVSNVLTPIIQIMGTVIGAALGVGGLLLVALTPIFWLGLIAEKIGLLDAIADFLNQIAKMLGYEQAKTEKEKIAETIQGADMADLQKAYEQLGGKGSLMDKFAELGAQGRSADEIMNSFIDWMYKAAKAMSEASNRGIDQSYWGDMYNDSTTGAYF